MAKYTIFSFGWGFASDLKLRAFYGCTDKALADYQSAALVSQPIIGT